MIIEYFIKNEEYKKQLKTIVFSTSNNIEVKKRNNKIQDEENYILRLTAKDDGRDGAKALSEVNQRIQELFNKNGYIFCLLTNEASQYYVKQLYPLVCKFETKLRKFIQSVLFNVNNKAQEDIFQKLKKEKKVDNKKQGSLSYNFLEFVELGYIQEFLFSNDELYSAINSYKKENPFLSQEEIIDFIKTSDKKSIWDEFFAKDFSDSILPRKFSELKKYRNDVMHFHEINDANYESAKALFDEVIMDLNKQIKKKIVVEVTEDKIQKLSNNADYLSGVLVGISELTKPLSLYATEKLTNLSSALRALTSSYTMDFLEGSTKLSQQLVQTVKNALFNSSILDSKFMQNIRTLVLNDSVINSIHSPEDITEAEDISSTKDTQVDLENNKQEGEN